MSARQQRLRELLTARARLDAQIVALGGISTNPPKAPRRKLARHGTESGYSAHRRQTSGFDKTPCDECLRAHAEYARARAYAQATRESTDLHTRVENPALTWANTTGPCDNGGERKRAPGSLATNPEALATRQPGGPLMTSHQSTQPDPRSLMIGGSE